MEWDCQICSQPNAKEYLECISCGNSYKVSKNEAAFLKKNTRQVNLPESKLDAENRKGSAEIFSKNWWNTEVNRNQTAILIFSIYFIFGGIASIGGAIARGEIPLLFSIFFSALGCGCLFSVRHLILNDSELVGKDRFSVVLLHGCICIAVCTFLFFKY